MKAPCVPDWTEVDHVVLDMDGTLLDLSFDNLVWNELLPRRYAQTHRILPIAARRHIERALGSRRGTLSWYCLDHWHSELGVDVAALEAEVEHAISVRPGAEPFLTWLVERGVKRVLATNAHPRSLARKLAHTGIGRYFDDIVSAHELGVAKEDDDFWSDFARRCGYRPARTLMIDDNHVVLRAARRHGIRHLYGVARPDSGGRNVHADEFHCIEAFTELTGAA